MEYERLEQMEVREKVLGEDLAVLEHHERGVAAWLEVARSRTVPLPTAADPFTLEKQALAEAAGAVGRGETMSLEVTVEPVPLANDADGVMRVGSSRVTLDTVIAAFREGMTPEGIVEQYPSLRLADVYAVIGYALNHSDEVRAYLRDRERLAEAVRQENEARFDPAGVRDRLLARRRQG